MKEIKKETAQLDPEQSVTCPSCGATWQRSRVCENCGNEETINYCPKCGIKL